MNVKRLIHSGFGKVIIPILLGLGLATMFRRVCKDRNCIVFKAPGIKNIEEKLLAITVNVTNININPFRVQTQKKQLSFA